MFMNKKRRLKAVSTYKNKSIKKADRICHRIQFEQTTYFPICHSNNQHMKNVKQCLRTDNADSINSIPFQL